MKEITKMSRLTGQLEKCFRMLNESFFDGQLPQPVLTVIPSSRSYAHYTPYDSWNTTSGGKREINIASGTLDRPLENVLASLLHEMCHEYNDLILNISDTSRGGTYHNKFFKEAAETHGLTCEKTEKYGWSHTEPGDELLDWILERDELREIEMCRINPAAAVSIGTHAGNMDGENTTPPASKGHSRRYQCPGCKAIIRATKKVNVICGDCLIPFVEG